jgi:adenylyltransferase/sulfurtransferase
MPTVQITSAIISAIQTQEAIKLLHDQNPSVGLKIFFQGTTNDYDVLRINANENCSGHATFPEIIPLSLGNSTKLSDFLEYVSQDNYSGTGAVLDFRSDRSFVESVLCRYCGGIIEMNRPSFRIYDHETVCSDCIGGGRSPQRSENSLATKNTLSEFCLKKTSHEILDMRLTDLGIPLFHVVSVRNRHGIYSYYELSADKIVVMPNLFSGNP